jgi:flagellar protein FliO/FliZ
VAAAAPAAISTPLPDLTTSLGQTLGGLLVVIAALFACLWIIKRLSSPRRGAGLMRVLGATALGPRERIVMVEAGNKVLMLGVTANNISALHVFTHDELVLPSPDRASATNDATVASFASRLRQALKGTP